MINNVVEHYSIQNSCSWINEASQSAKIQIEQSIKKFQIITTPYDNKKAH